jgi:signal transduction histidine kinase
MRAGEHDVWADPSRLQQVFWNLISNAAKFTPAGGRIAISSSDAGDGRVCVRVEDTGSGIDASALGRIFNAFEQGEQSLRRRHGGLGLGLTVAKAVVELHGGTIAAASAGPGRGATFSRTADASRATTWRRTRRPTGRRPGVGAASCSWRTTRTRRGCSRGCSGRPGTR